MPPRLVSDMSEEEKRGYMEWLKVWGKDAEEVIKNGRNESGEPGRGTGTGAYQEASD